MRFSAGYILLLVLMVCFVPQSPAALAPVPESGDVETAAGISGEPRFARLADIVQARSIPSEEELHDEEWEYYWKKDWPQEGPPILTPRHRYSEDRAEMTAAAVTAPVLKSSFPGIPNVGPAQPDSIIAVGPNHLMVAVNTEVAIYTKTGQKLFQTSFAEWFKSLTNAQTNNLFDPKLVYDQYSGHYIFLCDARRSDKRSWYLFSVSKTSDPTGEWAFWALDMQLNGTQKQDILWADFPRVGVDENAIYLTGNMTTFNTYLFKYAKLRILRKSQVYAFQKLTWRDFWKMKDGTGFNAYSMEPTHSFGPAPVEYLVNTSPFTGRVLTLWKVTGGGTPNPALTKRAITVSSYSFPPPAVQKGGGARLQTRECGLYNAIARNGSIYTAHSVSNDWNSGPVSAIRFYQVSTTGQVQQEITYGADKMYYFYPVVMPDSKGNVFLGFNRSSAGTYAGAFFTGRKPTDPPGRFQPSGRLAGGMANFKVVFNGSDIGRWGDYSGMAIDPADKVYFYSQYAKAPFEWATKVGILSYP